MHTFRVSPRSPARLPFDVEADSWTHALADALVALGLVDAHVDCDVQPDGSIVVAVRTDDGTTHTFALHDTSERQPPDVRLGDVPLDLSYRPEDAPAPMDAPAWRTYVQSGDSALAHVEERCAQLDHEADDERYVGAMLDLLMEVVPAQSSAILLAEDGPSGRLSRDLRFACARGPRAHGLRGVTVPAGRGIAGITVRAGIAITVREATVDPRHYGEVDERTGYRTHAILSVPIRSHAGPDASRGGVGQAIGCVQLLNPLAGTVFVPWHQTAVQRVAARLAARLT